MKPFPNLVFLATMLFAVSCSEQKKAEAPISVGQEKNVVRPIEFPKDEGAHPEQPIEWWYLNSQFSDTAGKDYSFFFAKFRTGRHLTGFYDKSADIFIPKDYYESVNAAEGKLDATSITGDWKQVGAPFHYTFKYSYDGVAIEASLKANKKPFLPNGNGFISMGVKGTSYYYALTDMTLKGTLKRGEETVEIHGTAWMDHQWGSWSWVTDFSKWKWYSVKLDNGVDLMLFNIYKDGTLVNSHCGYMDAQGNQFHKLQCELETLSYYTDSIGGKWQKDVVLTIPSLPDTKLKLSSEREGQFIEPLVFWEGSMKAEGTFKGTPVQGMAFGELNRAD